MIFFGLVEGLGRRDFRYDRRGQDSGGVDCGDDFVRGLFLFGPEIKNSGAVLRAAVVALPVFGRGVVDLEEELQNCAEAGLYGVEGDFHGFGMAGLTRANIIIFRAFERSARVADAGGDDSGAFADQILHPPETAPGEYGFLRCHMVIFVLSGLMDTLCRIFYSGEAELPKKGVLVLFRHGQTEYNKLHYMTGLHDVALTEAGEQQAQAAGALIRGFVFDLAYSSTLKRAHRTALLALEASGTNNHLKNPDGAWAIEQSAGMVGADSGEFTARKKHTEP